MYDDSWYSFVPDITGKQAPVKSPTQATRKRKESLLQQPNGVHDLPTIQQTLASLEEENDIPEATVVRRTRSIPSLNSSSQDVAARQDEVPKTPRGPRRQWRALDIANDQRESSDVKLQALPADNGILLDESRREFTAYADQLLLTENHLDSLIRDADDALTLLSSLSTSFKSVQDQTSSFKAQCEDLLTEQSRLEKLSNEVGVDLYYYAYLDNVSRRLNAPGASRLVDYNEFADVLDHLESCIEFMSSHPSYRDAESYLARYESLLTKALHLLEVAFSSKLEGVSQDISKQLAATKSESTRYALAYGRFSEMMLESHSLISNVQKVISRAFDDEGNPKTQGDAGDIFTNTAKNLFHAYLSTRDRDLRAIVQQDLDEFKAETKTSSVETACRNYTKQCFERAYSEANLFNKIFNVDPQPSSHEESAYTALMSGQRWLVSPANLRPLAINLQAILQTATLEQTCNLVAWLTHEFALVEYDEEESHFVSQCRVYAGTLLTDWLWVFVDSVFEADISRSITKAIVPADSLKIGPVTNGLASSNAHAITKTALELLAMYDQCMPKERCQQNSPVVFKVVRETIQVLQRADARIRSSKSETDPDLFMIKNLLILKNELVSLEIGDIRSSDAASMQHFGHIWDAVIPGSWMGFFGGLIGGVAGAGASLWSRGEQQQQQQQPAAVTAKTLTVEDLAEQLDELLRQSIYAYTRRWGAQLMDATSGKPGARTLASIEKELGDGLATAFGGQPEVVAKLKEAIQINARALKEADEKKTGMRRY